MTELLVTMAIAGILAAMAAPNFWSTLQRNAIWSDAATLNAALNRAHAEAIRLGSVVTICASADATTCSGDAADWTRGWIVFRPQNRANLTTVGAFIDKQVRGANESPIAQTTSATAVVFEPTGRINAAVGPFTVGNGAAARTLCLNVAGRTRLLQAGETAVAACS